MSAERTRERIVDLIQQMRLRTVDRGCTPAEAAGFAAKVAEWIERHQISEADLRGQQGSASSDEIEVCQNKLRTGKKVFNPGVTQVINSLAQGMCCRCIMLHEPGAHGTEATYGIIGSELDADFVCQMGPVICASLAISARLEGVEHGHEKAGLVRWANQYLSGAAVEIKKRIDAERKERSDIREVEHKLAKASGALIIVTGQTLAIAKRTAADAALNQMYPKTKTTTSHSRYDHTAQQCGREAGKRVGLHLSIG